jgi:hypothetical protein
VIEDGGVRLADPSDDAALAGLLHDFSTEFGTETDDRPVLERRFARILTDERVLVLLASDGLRDTGFALVALRPAIWFDGPVA